MLQNYKNLPVQETKKPPPARLKELVVEVFEENSKSIFTYLGPGDLSNLKKTSRIFYYTVTSFEIWNKLVQRVTKKPQAGEIKNVQSNQERPIVKKLEKKSSLIPLNRTSESFHKKISFEQNSIENLETEDGSVNVNMRGSFLKKNFYNMIKGESSKKNLVPGVNIPTITKPLPTLLASKNDEVNHQWLKKPKTFNINLKINFMRKPTTYAIDDKEKLQFVGALDLWLLEMKKLEKAIKTDAIATDSLMQEISIWIDVGKILTIFEEETKSDFLKSFEKYISYKKLTADEALNSKYQKFLEYKKGLLSNKDRILSLAEYMGQYQAQFKRIIQTSLLADFKSSIEDIINKIIVLFSKFDELIRPRIPNIFDKLLYLLLKFLQENHVSVSWTTETEDKEKEESLGIFSTISELLNSNWNYLMEQCRTQSVTENLITKKFKYVKTVITELIKMRTIFAKLNEKKYQMNKNKSKPLAVNINLNNGRDSKTFFIEFEKKLNSILILYKSTNIDFDIFDYNCSGIWTELLKGFKNRIKDLKLILENIEGALKKEVPAGLSNKSVTGDVKQKNSMLMSSTFQLDKKKQSKKSDEGPKFATFYRERKGKDDTEEEEKEEMNDSLSLQVQWKIT